MKRIIEVLRLKHAAKLSHYKIARACGLSKGVVGKYVSATQALGLTWPLPEGVDEARLEALLFPALQPSGRLVEPDYFQMHQALKHKGATLQLLWAEYVAVHGERGYRYSQYCNRYRQWRDRQKRSLRQVHLAGDKLFIDYCGPTVPIVDRHTGEIRAAQVFVAVLGASSYTFAEATYTQSLPDWIASHQRALAFFGGVPALLIPDKLLSAVTVADCYEPGSKTPPMPTWRRTTPPRCHSALLPGRLRSQAGLDHQGRPDRRRLPLQHRSARPQARAGARRQTDPGQQCPGSRSRDPGPALQGPGRYRARGCVPSSGVNPDLRFRHLRRPAASGLQSLPECGQSVEAAPQVGDPGREPDLVPRGQADHRRRLDRTSRSIGVFGSHDRELPSRLIMIDNPLPLHPGKVLSEIYMAEMGLSQTSLAKRCRCASRKINEIVNGKRGISPSFAITLESVLGTSAEMWVRMQAEYDLWEARRKVA
jgi:addiction module HigA family antidote